MKNCILNFIFSVLNCINFGLSSCIYPSINPHVCIYPSINPHVCLFICNAAFHKIFKQCYKFSRTSSQAEMSMRYHEIKTGGDCGSPVSNFVCKCRKIPFNFQKSTQHPQTGSCSITTGKSYLKITFLLCPYTMSFNQEESNLIKLLQIS